MKHVDTSSTVVQRIKSAAKKIKIEKNILLSEAQEIAAKEAGYENFHHVHWCASNTHKPYQFSGLGKLSVIAFEQYEVLRFGIKGSDQSFVEVTERLDNALDDINPVYKTFSAERMAHRKLINVCEHCTKQEPAFLDGYAHWMSALVEIKKPKLAVEIGLPVYDAACKLIDEAMNVYKLSPYELSNRPFYRVAFNLAAALYADGKITEAKTIANKMLIYSPEDVRGFKYFLEAEKSH